TTVSNTGNDTNYDGGYIYGSNTPTNVSAAIVAGGLQGIVVGVRFASVTVNKRIVGARANSADQFIYGVTVISNSNTVSQTSSGTGNGPFTPIAMAVAAGISVKVTDAMAAGSITPLSGYAPSLTCTNSNSGSSTALPTNQAVTSYTFGTLAFGDNISCTYTNTTYPLLTLTKSLGGTARRFSTDEFTMNLSNGSTVLGTTTTTGTGSTVANGSTPQVQGAAGTTYTLNEAASGTTDLTQYAQTLACTNAYAGSTTTLPTTVPGTVKPAMGDVISCTLTNKAAAANAKLTIVKSVSVYSDPINGTTNPKWIPGALVRYTLTVTNTGTLSVDTNKITIADAVPGTLTYDTTYTPVFTQGTPSSGLTGAAAAYSAPNLTITPSGTMAGATAAGEPNFSVTFQAKVN
ncbi:MAG: hypothetical protein KGQ42_07420, partial [Alphaproteobacteria bacterium]|nr:hypothetical protein [Alphaproteobacteria bacterium]